MLLLRRIAPVAGACSIAGTKANAARSVSVLAGYAGLGHLQLREGSGRSRMRNPVRGVGAGPWVTVAWASSSGRRVGQVRVSELLQQQQQSQQQKDAHATQQEAATIAPSTLASPAVAASSSTATPVAAVNRQDDKLFQMRSYFVGPMLDVDRLCLLLPPNWRYRREKDNVVFILPADKRTYSVENASYSLHEHLDSSVAVFYKGAIVFSNCDFQAYSDIFSIIRQANLLSLAPDAYVEDLTVGVRPTSEAWSSMEADRLVLYECDDDSLRILNSVMAQTVILDHHERQVDEMLNNVNVLNQALRDQDYSKFRSQAMFGTLAHANDITIQVTLAGLANQYAMPSAAGVFRPGSSAWKDEKYFSLQTTLMDEFELESRYEQLDKKVNHINDVIKYCLEVQKEHKFLRLERAIVYLITAELIMSLDHFPAVWETAKSMVTTVLGL